MKAAKDAISIPDEIVINKIIMVRGKKIMLDTDLVELYAVSTKSLNRQVKRNKDRFPSDFMFQLTVAEKSKIIKGFPHLAKLKYATNLPFAFTEHGAVMLASVLNSKTAIMVNVQIVRIFTRIRETLFPYKSILLRLEKLEKKGRKSDNEIRIILSYLQEGLHQPVLPIRKIGLKTSRDSISSVKASKKPLLSKRLLH